MARFLPLEGKSMELCLHNRQRCWRIEVMRKQKKWKQHCFFVFARQEAETEEVVSSKAEYLLDAYGNHILRLGYAYLHNMRDAEEILQETLIRFLTAQPLLGSPQHEKAWLLRVAANLSKNRIRYNKVRQADELSEALSTEENEDLSFVWEAVKALPIKYRDALHLFYYEGYSTAQIAHILGKKEATIRSYLHRGREQLKEILKGAYDFA